ncbi:MAG: cache domain-containing protein, partial [Spirochaetia bacterium]|nr:cache domain-containing protein [Spirochaetia bacterium]
MTELYEQELQQKKTAIEDFHEQYQSRFSAVLSQVDVQKVYSPNWDREYIFQHNNLFNTLHSEYQGLLFVRFISTDNKIHYSTREDDIERQGDYRVIYKVLEEKTTTIPIAELKLNSDQTKDILIDDEQNRFVYQFPLFDDLDQFRGTALFYVDKNSLQHFLVSRGFLQVGRQINLTENGYLFFGEGLAVDEIKETTSKRWNNNLVGERFVYHDDKTGQRFVLMSTSTDGYGNIGLLVNQSLFEMGSVLKVILLSASGITVFLLLLLLFSLRQDREVIIRNRLKRFQLEFIKGYIESQDRLDWRQLKNEVSRRKQSLKGEMKKGLGKIKGEKEEKIDELIDESWQDIFKVLDGRSETQKQTSSQVSIENIEEVVQKILSLQNSIESQEQTKGTTSESKPADSKQKQTTEQKPAEETEELEDFEEAEELGEAEAPEELEELGELEEAEEIGEAEEPEEPEKIGEAEDLEEAGEPEEAEEAEEIGETKELEETEELAEHQEIEEAEEPEELEELGELEEAEELEEEEATAELGEAEEAEEIGETKELVET